MAVLTRVAAVTSAGMTRTSPERTITFTDAVAIIVGNVIGSGIFISPRGVFVNAGSTAMALILWTLGGLLSAIGAVCYVRLGQLIPRSGGDYIYINKLWGRLPGFVTFWMTVAVANPLSQGISAITFASYLVQPLFGGCQPPQHAVRMIAASAISFLTVVNCLSVHWVMKIQNVFTAAKVSALALIIFLGLWRLVNGKMEYLSGTLAGDQPTTACGLAMALYFVLRAYSGWTQLNVVVGELQEPSRNLPRALALAVMVVTVVNVMTNLAYFVVVPPSEMASSDAVAVSFGAEVFHWMPWLIPVIVAISVFGNMNGNVFSAARVIQVGAEEGHFPVIGAMFHRTLSTPVPALLVNGMLTLVALMFDDVYSVISFLGPITWTITALSVAGLLTLRFRPDKSALVGSKETDDICLLWPIIHLMACIFLVVVPVVVKPLETVYGIFFVVGILILYVTTSGKNPSNHGAAFRDAINRSLVILLNVVPYSPHSAAGG